MARVKGKQALGWVKQNKGATAVIAAGTVAAILTSTSVAPEIKELLGGGFLGYVVGGGVSSAARSLLVNGALQRITRGKGKMDLRELGYDVGLSAVGGLWGFAGADLMGKGAEALKLSGLGRLCYNAVGLAVLETGKDGYQIALRNVARRKAGNEPKPIWQGMKECSVMEFVTGLPRIATPKSYPAKLASDIVATVLYYFIVNPDKKPKDHASTPTGQALINN